jgi:aryl-alcohol dehydrogenase-like predicted oxidoreductase
VKTCTSATSNNDTRSQLHDVLTHPIHEHLRTLAASYELTVAQLALGWLLAQGDSIVPIFGTNSRKRLEENVGAASAKLSEEVLAQVQAILPNAAFVGRYPASYMPQWS